MSEQFPLDQAHPKGPGFTPADPDDLPGGFSQTLTKAQPGCAPIAAASSVFDWRGPGNLPARVEPTPIQPEVPAEQESPVKQTIATARPTNPGPQFRVLAALAAQPDKRLSLAQLAEMTDLSGKALSNGLYNGKLKKRVKRLADGNYEITPAGNAFVLADRPAADMKFRAPKPRQRKAHTAPTTAAVKSARVVKVLPKPKAAKPAPIHSKPQAGEGFFTALTSDGRFLISKGNQQLVLNDAEYSQMCAYQARVAREAQ